MTGTLNSGLDLTRVKREWPDLADGSIYLNTGSCGRKPSCVISALEDAWKQLDRNPTIYTFFSHEETLEKARKSAAALFDAPPESLMLVQNAVQGLQLVFQSFLLEPGDELATTTREHGSVKAQVRFLEETRGILVKRHEPDPHAGSAAFCQGVLDLVGPKTRLVQVSEIDCYTGWRPDLTQLADELRKADVPLLVDGAHSPGQIQCRPSRFPLWVGSGHKWLGGPNGTGFLYVAPDMVTRLRPFWVADPPHYPYFDQGPQLRSMEYQGTTDLTRWPALAAACDLQLALGPDAVEARHKQLLAYFRNGLVEQFPKAQIKTPDPSSEATAMLTVSFEPDKLKVDDLQNHFWHKHRIWLQPDFLEGKPGQGFRISCHASISEQQLDRFLTVLRDCIKS